MKKQWVNYTIDIIMLIAFIILFFTGLFKFPGLLSLLNVNMRAIPVEVVRGISLIHDIAGLAMLISGLSHIILHLNWMGRMTGKIFKGTSKKQP